MSKANKRERWFQVVGTKLMEGGRNARREGGKEGVKEGNMESRRESRRVYMDGVCE